MEAAEFVAARTMLVRDSRQCHAQHWGHGLPPTTTEQLPVISLSEVTRGSKQAGTAKRPAHGVRLDEFKF
jgi:hypothetical protein